jgi:hypothetical protein
VSLLESCIDSLDRETVNAAGPEKMSVTDFARNIYREEGYPCYSFHFPDRPLKIGLRIIDRLPRPLAYGHYKLLRHSNTTDDNHIEDLVRVDPVFN